MSEDKMKNTTDIDSLADEVLANEQSSEQTMIDLSSVATSKDTAKSTLFNSDPKSDIAYINDVLNNKNFTSGSKGKKAEATKPVLTKEEIKENKEFEQFDEEINYRKKLAKIMKRSTPTEPFTMNVVSEEPIENPESEAPLDLGDSDEKAFEYFSHDQMGKFDKISVRTYSTQQKSSSYSPYLLINKLLFFTMLIVFGIYALEIGIFFLFMRDIIERNYVYYLVLLFIAMIPLGVGVFKYSLNSDLKVKKKMNFLNMALNSIIVVVLSVVVILIITLLTQTSVLDFADLLPKIVIPIVMIANYPIGLLVYYLLYRSEKFFE
ncbi:MAG: hypothetical protein R3Y18_04670 [Bacillota bacterium]